MKPNKVLSFHRYSTAQEEWGHAIHRCKVSKYSRFSSLRGHCVCLLLLPAHILGVGMKPIYYAACCARSLFEAAECMLWKANFFGDFSRSQSKLALDDACDYAVNVIVSPAGQVMQAGKAALGIFHPKAYFKARKNHLQSSDMAGGEKVVIVGAGPVGLLTAIQAKILDPELDICIVEKYQEYQRNNLLNLEKRSFAKLPRDERLQTIVDGFFGNKKSCRIQTNRIEREFKDYAEDLGIKFEHRIVHPDEVENCDASVVVCADGAHSTNRKAFTGKKASKKLQHVVQLKYCVEGKSKPFSFYKQYPAMKAAGYLVEESAKYDRKRDRTTMCVRFFVEQEDYASLVGDDKTSCPSFKNPLRDIESPLLTHKLKDAIHLWLNYRQEKGETAAESIEITPIKLSIYQARRFSLPLENEKVVAFVGDAASGVPFFRSLNKGVLESSLLAKTIAKGNRCPEKKEGYFKNYNRKMRLIAARETRVAISKNSGLKSARGLAVISSKVPWQMNKIKKKRVAQLKSASPLVR